MADATAVAVGATPDAAADGVAAPDPEPDAHRKKAAGAGAEGAGAIASFLAGAIASFRAGAIASFLAGAIASFLAGAIASVPAVQGGQALAEAGRARSLRDALEDAVAPTPRRTRGAVTCLIGQLRN
jgi:hypothetical protein